MINITLIERLTRYFAAPGLLIIGGAIGLFLIPDADSQTNPMIAIAFKSIQEPLRWLVLAMLVVGILWWLSSAWELLRWERGDLIGGCTVCAGVMQHKMGRYGPYGVCKMCGSKREGHH